MITGPKETIDSCSPPSESLTPPKISGVDCCLVYPGGNDTYIAFAPSITRADYPTFNRWIMSTYRELEQGGFLETGQGTGAVKLHMAGGEFCGNATRAAAALFIDDFEGERRFATVADYSLVKSSNEGYLFPIEVSGTDRALSVTCERVSSKAWMVETEMPLPPLREIREILDIEGISPGVPVIHLDGISHLVLDSQEVPFDKDNYEERARSLLQAAGLTTRPAAGVIWRAKRDDCIEMNPVVFVSSINTCFYETSCGSGATALVLDELLRNGVETSVVKVVPPSEVPLTVTIKVKGELVDARLKGVVELRGRL